jgi:hypothetical protein
LTISILTIDTCTLLYKCKMESNILKVIHINYICGRLNYLTITRLYTTFALSIVSQFINALCDSHWNTIVCILRYIKNAPWRRLSYMEIMVILKSLVIQMPTRPNHRRIEDPIMDIVFLLGGNMISWEARKNHSCTI